MLFHTMIFENPPRFGTWLRRHPMWNREVEARSI